MTPIHTLAAFLLLGDAAPSVATADCPLDDNGCKARRSELRAASAQTPDQRATYLRSAHRSYLFLFDKTGDVLDLCSARRSFDASMAVKDQSADERARTRVLRDDLVARERKAGASCKGATKPRRASRSEAPPVVASVAESKAPPVDPPVHAADLTSEPPPPLLTSTTTPEPAPKLAPIPIQRVPSRPNTDVPRPGRGLVTGDVTPSPAVEGPASAPPIRPARQLSRTRVGVGVGLVTVGTGLLVGMTAVLVGRHGYDEKIATLHALGEQENRDLTTQEMADISSWDARYVQLERTGAVLGGLAAVSVVTAIVVFVMPEKRAASQARVRPVGAGVHINF